MSVGWDYPAISRCVDCGEWIEVGIDSKRIRCDKCFDMERRRIEREKKRKQRLSHQLIK